MITRQRVICLAACLFPLAGTGCIVVGIGGWSSWQGPTVWTAPTTSQIPIDSANLQAMEVRTHNGSITFDGQPAGITEAFVDVTVRAGGLTHADAEKALEAIDVYVERGDADAQRIGWKWKGVKKSTWRAQVSFDIKAPGRLSFEGRTHNGAIKIKGVLGEVRVATHNGTVNVESRDGRLHAETHNGSIVAAYMGDDLTLMTHNGRVTADLKLCGTLKGSVTTHNGSVEIVAGDGMSAQLTCRTHNGSIRCDVPLNKSHFWRRKLIGMIGSGEGDLEVTTHNGSVHIRQVAG